MRAFTLACLDDVPVVGRGHLKRRPHGADWWLRLIAAPDDPGPKDKKTNSWQLVFRSPVLAPPKSGGGVGIAPGTMTLKARDLSGAKTEALILIARAQGKTIRASTWPIERIERLRCRDLLQKYLDLDLRKPKDRKETRAENKHRRTYSAALKAFQRAFPTLELGDCNGRIDRLFEERTGHTPRSRHAELRTVKMALLEILRRMGVKDYKVAFVNKYPGRLKKVVWTPADFDRLLELGSRLAAPSRRHAGDDPRPARPGPGAEAARPPQGLAEGDPVSDVFHEPQRPDLSDAARWVGPEVEPAGRPLPKSGEERPWLEVLDDRIVFHRDGEERYDGNKRHGPNIVPREFEPSVREWYAQDMAAGLEWVFHKLDGERYRRAALQLDVGRDRRRRRTARTQDRSSAEGSGGRLGGCRQARADRAGGARRHLRAGP